MVFTINSRLYSIAKHVWLCCIIPIISFACAREEVDLLKSFEDAKKLSPDMTVEGIIDSEPFGFAVRDSIAFFYSSMMGEDQLLAVNMNDNKRYTALKIGRGPGEAIHVNSIALSGDTLNVEAEPEMTLQYRIDRIPETLLKPFNVIEHPGVLGRGEMTAFLHNYDDPENSTMYASIPRNDSTVVFWGKFPEGDKMEYPAFDESKQTAYQGHLVISPDCTKAVFVFYYAIGFDVLDLGEHTVRHFFWKHPQVNIQYIDMLSVNLVKGTDGWQRGFCDAGVTDKHIYLLYKNTDASFVLVYDWDGEPVKAYSFEEEVIKIFVEPTGTKLYTLSIDENYECDLNIYTRV